MQHPAIMNASVVGITDSKYGEVVGAFLQCRDGHRLSDREISEWVHSTLARQKTPRYNFWLGSAGVGNEFPVTGSGKIKKNVLRDLGNSLVKDGIDRDV